MRLGRIEGRLAVVRRDPAAEIPHWAGAASFLSITRTGEELSIVCDETLVPDSEMAERGWSVFKVHGPIAFTLTGVVSSLTMPLAAEGIPVFVISTFDTDYLLVKAGDADRATKALMAAGHELA